MRDSQKVLTQLQLIDEVNRLLSSADIPHWLFGGWSVDFHAGRVTREHGDIEFFIWENDAPRAADVMGAAGYMLVDHPHPEEALIWKKEGGVVELYYNVLNQRGQVVGRGRWGEWPLPTGSLGSEVRALAEVQSPVVSAACILSVKEEYERYTGVPMRDRDRADVEVLRRLLSDD
jgi:hypothetical protein